MPALLILGLVAVAGVGTGMYVSAANFQDPNLSAKVLGMDMSNAVAVGGLLLAFLASGPLAMAGLAAAVGSIVAGYDAKAVKAGLQAHAVQQVNNGAAALPAPAPPALPGPGAAAPAPSPGAAPGASFLDFLSPARPAAAPAAA